MDIEDWAISLMEKHNRKSHLAPQLSPSTQSLLRNDDSASSRDTPNTKTPTSGEILIARDVGQSPPSSVDSNGAGTFSRHPGHPPRTSSANAVPMGARSGGSGTGSTTTLPMRPAPPPAGPLPATPATAGQAGMIRQSSYQSTDQESRRAYMDHDPRESRRQPSIGVPYTNGG